jgi:hypothetical protein
MKIIVDVEFEDAPQQEEFERAILLRGDEMGLCVSISREPDIDPNWPDAHCVDCGYPRLTKTAWAKGKGNTERLCRKHGCDVWRHTKACPAYCKRAKEKK